MPCFAIARDVFRRQVRLALAMGLGLGSVIGPGLVLPARAIPRLDLTPYPAPAPGQRRWVIQVSALLIPSPDPQMSRDPADWRVQLLVGRSQRVDCNQHHLQGSLSPKLLSGSGLTIYEVVSNGRTLSSRRACPPGEPLRDRFVTLAEEPALVPYRVSQPIVVYGPSNLELRWRLWKAQVGTEAAALH